MYPSYQPIFAFAGFISIENVGDRFIFIGKRGDIDQRLYAIVPCRTDDGARTRAPPNDRSLCPLENAAKA